MRDLKDLPEEKPVMGSLDGVHLLRTTQQVQYQLSQMADQKASMLLGITFVIFTIAVGQSRVGDFQPAVLILGAAAFAAAFLAVLAVLPSVKGSRREDGSVGNILFFGSFTRLSEQEYVDKILGIVANNQSVYEAFARDIYQNGSVLAGKKYRLLGYSYRVLLVGLVASMIAFWAPFLHTLATR